MGRRETRHFRVYYIAVFRTVDHLERIVHPGRRVGYQLHHAESPLAQGPLHLGVVLCSPKVGREKVRMVFVCVSVGVRGKVKWGVHVPCWVLRCTGIASNIPRRDIGGTGTRLRLAIPNRGGNTHTRGYERLLVTFAVHTNMEGCDRCSSLTETVRADSSYVEPHTHPMPNRRDPLPKGCSAVGKGLGGKVWCGPFQVCVKGLRPTRCTSAQAARGTP